MQSLDKSRRTLKILAWLFLAVSILFFHTWRLSELPAGMYVDETSIGLNGALIAESGHDEYGITWPVFFKAFGDYKNPLYIYVSAGVFKIFGVSEFTLRLTSAIFFFWFVAALAVLIQRQFRNARITFLTVLTAGFLPYFFPLSRIAFEVVSQLSITVTWLLLLHLAYVRPIGKIHPSLASFAAGLVLGASAYSYSTGRLLAFLFMLIWIVCLANKRTWQLTVIGIAGFVVALIPYGMFSLSYPSALTARFHTVTYMYDPLLDTGEKISTFVGNYFRYFSPKFLLVDGDTNLRHSSGFGGAVFATSFVIAALGVAEIVKRFPKDRFAMLTIFMLLVSPVAAALTTGETGHALRSVTLGIGLLILLSYGLDSLQKMPNWRAVFISLSLLTAVEASAYLNHYFTKYPAISASWFETQGLYPALKTALKQAPQNIIIASSMHQVRTSVGFYSFVLPGLQKANIQFRTPIAQPGACIIYSNTAPIIDHAAVTHSPQSVSPSLIKIRCYPTPP